MNAALYSTSQNLGFTMWNPPGVRVQGLMACNDMAMGNNWRITVTKLMNIGYTFDEAADILAAAVTAYCPAFSRRTKTCPKRAVRGVSPTDE